ncbi:MAG: PEP-CTERM sorting domain-containing protein [Paucibacter sp.]|nr:PEP-CTERM sorting domain-containing protein [Roseateles sp.]
MKKSVLQRLFCASAGLGLFAVAGGAQALIAGPTDGEIGQIRGSDKPELVLWMFDPVKEVSFTKDLGTYVAPFNPDLNNSKNFFVQAQQDGGYQKFFEPLNSDANFQKFLSVSSNPANQLWGVYASGDAGFGLSPGEKNFFTTLKSTDVDGQLNQNYTSLLGVKNEQLNLAVSLVATAFQSLNESTSSTPGVDTDPFGFNIYNSHKNLVEIGDSEELLLYNGSSFDQKGITFPYYGGILRDGKISGDIPPSMNAVGSSSWFYYLTASSANDTSLILVDEFDNLGHDGYWGLALNDKSEYILSFTMQAHMTAASTAQGLARRNRTDFSALYGGVRSLTTPTGEFIGWAPNGSFTTTVSAVPEPATYGLFGLGLAALAWRQRKQARNKVC